jgi:hypothetical protein
MTGTPYCKEANVTTKGGFLVTMKEGGHSEFVAAQNLVKLLQALTETQTFYISTFSPVPWFCVEDFNFQSTLLCDPLRKLKTDHLPQRSALRS